MVGFDGAALWLLHVSGRQRDIERETETQRDRDTERDNGTVDMAPGRRFTNFH